MKDWDDHISYGYTGLLALFLMFACTGCSVKYEDMGGELEEQGKRTLVLPDGRGCTGKLRYTGGGYAAVHYNFNCDDGRIYVNLTNAEVE